MNHWVAAPIVIPLAAGGVLLALARSNLAWKRSISAVACVAELLVCWKLAAAACGSNAPLVYSVGNWPAPYGIVLVVDRLAALMLVLTAVVALVVFGYATLGDDTRGRGFHALYQFQVLGLYGTFLTGDLFNLFVFIEILLIASYGLLLQGTSSVRSRAGFHYVVVNLVGSSLFLLAVGLFYGVLGTVNLADLSVKMASVRPEDAGLVRTAAALLLIVFALKGAVVPFHFWLPETYAAALGPVAALFSLLTKAGVYAVMRVMPLIAQGAPGWTANVANSWLVPAGLVTVLVGAAGALASTDLRRLVSYGVLVSTGTLCAGIGLYSLEAMAASLYYLIHTTLVTAALFLLTDVTARHRDRGSELVPASAVPKPALLGTLFFIGALAMAGVPPLSGFTAKVLLLRAAMGKGLVTVGIWAVFLLSGLALVVALQRAGSVIFWQDEPGKPHDTDHHARLWWPITLLLAMSPALVLGAGSVSTFCLETAAQVMDPGAYVSSVLGMIVAGGAP